MPSSPIHTWRSQYCGCQTTIPTSSFGRGGSVGHLAWRACCRSSKCQPVIHGCIKLRQEEWTSAGRRADVGPQTGRSCRICTLTASVSPPPPSSARPIGHRIASSSFSTSSTSCDGLRRLPRSVKDPDRVEARNHFSRFAYEAAVPDRAASHEAPPASSFLYLISARG